MFALGVTFRYSAWESQKNWTEGHIAKSYEQTLTTASLGDRACAIQ